MHTCLICGIAQNGVKYRGKWFCDEECVKVYCAFMGIAYEPQKMKKAA